MRVGIAGRKKLLFGIVAITASLLMVGVGGEVLSRLFLSRYWDTELLRAQLTAESMKSIVEPDEDPAIEYALRPNLDREYRGSRLLTDTEGIRVAAEPPPAREDAMRIALIGDSTSFGWGVEYEDSYGEQLRRALEAERGAPVLLRNYSVPGYNAIQEHQQFLNKIAPTRPHVLIVHHDHNDALPANWGYDKWLAPEEGDNFIHSALIKLIIRKVKNLKMELLPDQDSANKFLDNYCISGPLYDSMLESRRSLVEAARAEGIPVVGLIFNTYVEAKSDYQDDPMFVLLHQGLARDLDEMGYRVMDMYPRFQTLLAESDRPDLSHFWVVPPDDAHPNPEGHAYIAAQLTDFFKNDAEISKLLSP